jgi:uncharacterized protein YecT (DUF1311 family)
MNKKHKMFSITTIIFFLVLLIFSITQRSNSFSQTQSDMNQKAYDNYIIYDRELNSIYEKLEAKLDTKQKNLLILSQIAWIKYREANTAVWTDQYKDGSIYPVLYFDRMTKMTKDRISELTEMMRETEGK